METLLPWGLLSYCGTLLLRCTSIIAPCQADIIEIEIGQLSVNCGEDLDSRQITKILSELDIGQLAASTFPARWYGDILKSGPYGGSQFVTVYSYLAIRRSFVLAANPKRKGVDPESAIK